MWMDEQQTQPPLKAVIDRIEGRTAVLLVGEEEYEMLVPSDALPEGADEGSWLTFRPFDGALQLDQEETARRGERIEGKLEQLRRRGRPAPE